LGSVTYRLAYLRHPRRLTGINTGLGFRGIGFTFMGGVCFKRF
jgi:hypothetical protein